MGSFRAKFECAGEEFDVLQAEYEFSRDTDKKGKPSSGCYGGRVKITVESTESTLLMEKMLTSQFNSVDATLTFLKSGDESDLKQLTVNNAYIVYYKESLEVNGETPMTITFTLSAEEISMGDAAIDNRWATA